MITTQTESENSNYKPMESNETNSAGNMRHKMGRRFVFNKERYFNDTQKIIFTLIVLELVGMKMVMKFNQPCQHLGS